MSASQAGPLNQWALPSLPTARSRDGKSPNGNDAIAAAILLQDYLESTRLSRASRPSEEK